MRCATRKTFTLLLALGCLLTGSSGCDSEGRRAKAVAHGNDLFAMHCSGCHSRRRLDLEKVPPDLHGVFDRRFLPSGRSATDELVRSTILTGRSGIMPSFEGSLSDDDIHDIILYLHTLKLPPPAAARGAVTPEQSTRPRQLSLFIGVGRSNLRAGAQDVWHGRTYLAS